MNQGFDTRMEPPRRGTGIFRRSGKFWSLAGILFAWCLFAALVLPNRPGPVTGRLAAAGISGCPPGRQDEGATTGHPEASASVTCQHCATVPSGAFQAEMSFVRNCLYRGGATASSSDYRYAAEFFDDFDGDHLSSAWSPFGGDGTTGHVSFEGGRLVLTYPLEAASRAVGIRSRERLVSVPDGGNNPFLVKITLDTSASCSGTVVLVPERYDSLFGRPSIGLSYVRGDKVGTVSLEKGLKELGSFKVSLSKRLDLTLAVGSDRFYALDAGGVVMADGELPGWAAPGTSLYIGICAVSCPNRAKGRLVVDAVRLRHPLRLMVRSCIDWHSGGRILLDDDFSTVDQDAWVPWSDGGHYSFVRELMAGASGTARIRSANGPKGGARLGHGGTSSGAIPGPIPGRAGATGLYFSVKARGGAGKWGRYGLFSARPVVPHGHGAGQFTAIEADFDMSFTSGARMVLVTSPRDTVWGTPHLRLGMERRGLVCEAWLGDDRRIASCFQLPLDEHCLVTMVVGRYGLYAIGADCRLMAGMPLPGWAVRAGSFYLAVYSQSARPFAAVSFGLHRLRLASCDKSNPSTGAGGRPSTARPVPGSTAPTGVATSHADITDACAAGGSAVPVPGSAPVVRVTAPATVEPVLAPDAAAATASVRITVPVSIAPVPAATIVGTSPSTSAVAPACDTPSSSGTR